MAVAVLGDTIYSALHLRGLLGTVRSAAVAGTEALSRMDVGSAQDHFGAARDAAHEARATANHPGPTLISHLPFIGADAVALRALAAASSDAAEAGVEMVEIARSIGSSGDLFSGLYSEGAVQVDAAVTIGPRVQAVAALLRRAESLVVGAPDPHLGAIRDAVEDAKSKLADATATADSAVTLLDVLPELFGGNGQRRYLMVFQSPSEARATGGFPGLFGVLTATDGRLKVSDVGPPPRSLRLGTGPSVQAPRWFERRYEPSFGNRAITQTNVSPHFPVAADVMMRLYEGKMKLSLDGVIAMDPIALGYLTGATGPIDTRRLPPIGPGNAARVLLHDSYTRFADPQDQNPALARVVDLLWKKVAEGTVDSFELGSALATSVRTQHLKLFSERTGLQEQLASLGATGDFTTFGPQVQLVYNNALAANKVDYFTHRAVETVITLDRGGDAQIDTTIVFENKAPDGPPSVLLGGTAPGHTPGTNEMYLNLLMPEGAELRSFEYFGGESPHASANEAGYPVVWHRFHVAAGETAVVEASYVVPDAVTDGLFELTLFPQPMVNPDNYYITVIPPDGYGVRPVDASGRAATSFQRSGELIEPVTVALELVEG